MIQPLLTRLDKKTGREVLCGRIECGTELSEVYRLSRQEIEKITEESGEDIQVIDHLAFPSGWAPRRNGSLGGGRLGSRLGHGLHR